MENKNTDISRKMGNRCSGVQRFASRYNKRPSVRKMQI